jgi:hypothetical protein
MTMSFEMITALGSRAAGITFEFLAVNEPGHVLARLVPP